MDLANTYVQAMESLFYDAFAGESVSDPVATMPSEMGDGAYSLHTAHGVQFSYSAFKLHEDSRLSGVSQAAHFFVSVMESGSTQMERADTGETFQLRRNRVYLGFQQSGEEITSVMRGGETLRSLSFFMSRARLCELLAGIANAQLMEAIRAAEKSVFLREIPMSPKARYVIHKFVQNPYQGELRNIYNSSVIHELLPLLLQEFCDADKPEQLPLSQRDREALTQARGLLLTSLQSPPTIATLSRQVGLNQNKLKNGFKQMFGTTIFQTLTTWRMEYAFEALKTSETPIDNIALETGYENVSNFIRAFKRHFGMTPGQLRRACRDEGQSLPSQQ